MIRLLLQGRTVLLAVLVISLGLFIYVAVRSGPMAPVLVTVAPVESHSLSPTLFGVGTVEVRYTHKIGPTFAGRVKRVDVHVGDHVKAGQVLGEMDPVDLDDRVRSQEFALRHAAAALRQAEARRAFAQAQLKRYEQVLPEGGTSEESVATKRQELDIANADLAMARESLARAKSDHAALVGQRSSLLLITPVNGVITARHADPSTTIVAGQAVVEVADPANLWINTRFDQINATGLVAGLPSRIELRSHKDQVLKGHVLRTEPKADSVTEEMLAKVILDERGDIQPAIGEFAEVTVDLAHIPSTPVIPNAAVHRVGERVGVWQIADGNLRFASIKLGVTDLDGHVQVKEGLKSGDHVVVYSEKALTRYSRIHVVDHIPLVLR